MKEKFNYYIPKEKSSSLFYPMAAIMLVFIAPMLSVFYAELQSFIDSLFFSLIIYVVLLIGMIGLINAFLKYARVADDKLSNFFSYLFILVFFYLHWSAHLYVEMHKVFEEIGRIGTSVNFDGSDDHYFSLAMHPSSMWTYITINATSVWTWILWLIELLGFALVALVSGTDVELDPYSEITKEDYNKKVITVNQISKKNLLELIKSKEYSNVESIEKHIVSHSSYSKIYIYTSPNEQSYLSLVNVKADISKGGEPEFEENVLVRNIAIDEELKGLLLKIDSNKVADNKEIEVAEEKVVESNIQAENTKKEISHTEKLIEKPEIIFNVIEGSSGVIFHFLFLGIGMGLIYFLIKLDYQEVWGFIIALGISGYGIVGFIGRIGISKEDMKAVVRINPSNIYIKALVNNVDFDVALKLDDIDKIVNNEKVFNKSKDEYIYKITIYLKPEKVKKLDFVIIEMNALNVDKNNFEKLLNLLINAKIKDRVDELNRWKKVN